MNKALALLVMVDECLRNCSASVWRREAEAWRGWEPQIAAFWALSCGCDGKQFLTVCCSRALHPNLLVVLPQSLAVDIHCSLRQTCAKTARTAKTATRTNMHIDKQTQTNKHEHKH